MGYLFISRFFSIFVREKIKRMILLLDVHYDEVNNSAHIAGIITDDWISDKIISIYEIDKNGIDCAYIPGQFYKREMPCLIELWNSLSEYDKSNIDTIIVDGFYDIWNGSKGLGHHFKDWLTANGYNKEVVGIAKNPCRETNKFTLPVYRTEESKTSKCRSALWVNGSKMENDYQSKVLSMHGKYRIPTLIKAVDKLSRKIYN